MEHRWKCIEKDYRKPGMIVDYHTHNRLCRHAQGDLEEYVQAAIRLGLDEVACSDHAPLPGDYDPRHRMTLEEFNSDYTPVVSALKEKYGGKIRIKYAIEVDYLDWAAEWNQKFIGQNDFDFVLGSVHFIGPRGQEKPLFGPEYGKHELESLYEGYYQTIADSAKSGMFDVISHCDIVKKFGIFSSKRVDDLVREAMTQIRNGGLCIEVNTSGLRKPEKETYPSQKILALARELKIPLTIGSDAHTPEDVGRDFDIAVDLVQAYGGGRLSVFEKRQRTEVNVSRLRTHA
ncbi:MAG: histidinol-phosphatase HisJ [Ignavibacteriales bacterium]|nr:histidinol-phosphatase HisJ [Ignavibacteriales bacterium]